MEIIKVGKIVGAVGLKGEVKVYSYTNLDRFAQLEEIKAGKDTYGIEGARVQKNVVVLKLKGVNDRNKAESMRDLELSIDESQLPELDSDEFFIKDLIGLAVFNYETNEELGALKDIIQTGPQDTYIIKRKDGKEFLIPAVKEFIKSVDLKEGISVKVIPGLIDDEI